MRTTGKFIYLCALILLNLCVSCSRVEVPHCSDGEVVELTLDVDILTPVTKGVYDPDDVSDPSSVVKNLWVIQFDGTSDDAALLGEPTYIPDFASYDGRVSLVSTKTPCAVFLIANTFEDPSIFNIPQGYKIKELRSRSRSVTKESDIMGIGSDGVTCHPIFMAEVVASDGIDEGEHLEAELRRNISKITVNIENTSAAPNAVTIQSVQICNVPDVSYYIYSESGVSAPYPNLPEEKYINYAPVPWDGTPVVAYLPVNLQGIVQGNNAESAKNRYAPKGATYVEVNGTYIRDGNTVPVTYTFYLGGNMVNDYNLKGNYSYTYNFTINSLGDADSDTRVEDWGMVDFSTSNYPLANCYILNPIPSGTAGRIFRIPIQRLITFWGRDGYAPYENDEYLSLRTNGGKWRAWVLASDFKIENSNFVLTKSEGTKDADRYFEVKVSPGTKGNVIVAVGPDDGTQAVSWSWHLWITDYDPSECLDWGDGVQDKYMYGVRNGFVHRYAGAYWESNRSVYIMDRNIGCISDPSTYPSDNWGLLYYQFGRKDPIFFNSGIYKYPEGSTVHRYAAISKEVASVQNSVLYVVKNPLHFITTKEMEVNTAHYPWNSDTKYNPTPYDKNIVWQDPATTFGGQREGQKSIFDPCPPGYRLPDSNIWSDFSPHVDSKGRKGTTNAFYEGYKIDESKYERGYEPYHTIRGLQYWPFFGENILIPEDVVYYPASGYKNPVSGSIRNDGLSDEKWVFLWSEDPYSDINGAGLGAQDDMIRANSPSRARAFPVRCVTER